MSTDELLALESTMKHIRELSFAGLCTIEVRYRSMPNLNKFVRSLIKEHNDEWVDTVKSNTDCTHGTASHVRTFLPRIR